MINLAVSYFSKKITVLRDGGGDYDELGDFVEKSDAKDSIMGSVQRLRGQDLKDMPEGKRNEAKYLISTVDILENDDIVIHKGQKHLVIHEFDSTLGFHRRYAIGLLAKK